MEQMPFDAQMQRAWDEYELGLAVRLYVLGRDDTLTVSAVSADVPDGPHPRVVFTVTGAGRVRATISDADLSADPDGYAEQIDGMAEIGWRHLANGTHIVEAGKRNLEKVAFIVTRAFLGLWHITHPAFLDDADEPPAEPSPDSKSLPFTPAAVLPVILDYLAGLTGLEDCTVEDDRITLPSVYGTRSWISLSKHGPWLECAANLGSAPDNTMLGQIIAAHALRWPYVTLLVAQDSVFAVRSIDAADLSPDNFVHGLGSWHKFLAHGAPAIVELISDANAGRPWEP